MNVRYFLTIKREDDARMITEEIPISPAEAQQIRRRPEEQRAYNAAEHRNNTPVAHGGKPRRQGPATDGQRDFIAIIQRNPIQRNKMEKYILEHDIDMDNLTNAQANDLIQAGKN